MKHKHLTLSDRIEIELGITQGFSFRKIASIIEKNPSTVSKEIKNLGLEVVKVFVAGFHQLTGDHNYPFLGSFQSNLNNLFLKFPHFFP